MKYTPFVLVAAVIVFLAYFFFGTNKDTRESKTQNTGQQQQKTQGGFEAKADEQGQVIVKITPLVLSGARWRFNVVFDTHSVELDQDLVQIAELSDNRGNTYEPMAWEGAEPGGHHREGILVFKAINPMPSYVGLKIKNVGGVPERLFKWDTE